MPDRPKQIRQLLATRYDGLYLPAGALRTPSGLAPGEKKPCPDCGHTEHPGHVIDVFKRETPCGKCGGKGHVFVDRMDSLEVPIGDESTTSTARPRKTVTCDACNGDGVRLGTRCVYCDGVGRRDMHVFELSLAPERESSGDPMTDAIEARNASGSYRELELALAGIRVHVNKPAKFHWLTLNATTALRLIDEVFIGGRSDLDLKPGERALVDLGIAYIETRMPTPIRVPGWVRLNEREIEKRRTRARGRGSDPHAHAQRQREMRQHARDGRSPQWIAAEYEVSVSTVYEVVNRKSA